MSDADFEKWFKNEKSNDSFLDIYVKYAYNKQEHVLSLKQWAKLYYDDCVNVREIKMSKRKKCENHCPQCGSGGEDIEYDVSFSVDDGVYHQRAYCTKCQLCFIEVSEVKYIHTVIDTTEGA